MKVVVKADILGKNEAAAAENAALFGEVRPALHI